VPDHTDQATRRDWAGLIVLLMPTLLLTTDLGLLWLAAPAMATDLSATSTELLWINDAYGFATAPLLILFGNLGDRLGRRRMVLAGAAGFLVASVLAALASDPWVVVAARALLGVSGAAILPATLGLISATFREPGQRRSAIAAWVTALSLGIGLGPVIGGLMISRWWWGSLFLIAVPVMIIALVAVPLLVRESRDRRAGSLDWRGVPLLVAALLLGVFTIKRMATDGPDLTTVCAAAFAIIAGVAFTRRQRRSSNPLIDPALFRIPRFRAALAMLVINLAAMNGVEFLLPQYLITRTGSTPLTAGLWLVAPAVALAFGSQLTSRLARRFDPRWIVVAGAVIAAGGLGILIATPDAAWLAACGLSAVLFGLAPVTVLGTEFAVSAAPSTRAGAAAAIGQTSYELGLALGIATIGTVASTVYRLQVSALPGDRSTLAEIGDSFSTGPARAEGLGDPLATAVHDAFAIGFRAAALTSLGLTVLLVVVTLTLLPRVGPAATEVTATAPGTDRVPKP
jgi:DHA2 family multidrug resistance protein-like MFS transporter